MDDKDKSQINFWDSRVKKKWEDFVKESGEYSLLSQLVSTAANREVTDGYLPRTEFEAVAVAVVSSGQTRRKR